MNPSARLDSGCLLSKSNAKDRGGEVASQEWLFDRSRFVTSCNVGSGAGVSRLDSSCRKSPLWRADLGLSMFNPSCSLSSGSLSKLLTIGFSGVIVTGGSSVAEPGDLGLGLPLGEREAVCWKIDSSCTDGRQRTNEYSEAE